jgi:lactoylglutathione lyase
VLDHLPDDRAARKNTGGRMPYQKVTPNLMVKDVSASLKFYQETLGLERRITVPEQEPFVFFAIAAGDVEIFLNQDESGGKAQAGGISLYVELEGLNQLLERVQQHQVKIEILLNDTFYGMREFAVLDPDGYMIIFAERIKK